MLLDRFAPTSQDHVPISSTYYADSHPCGTGCDDVYLEDMFADHCAVSCHYESEFDIFGASPLTGDPLMWDDIRSENSDDYVVQEDDECAKLAGVETNCPGDYFSLPTTTNIETVIVQLIDCH